MESGTEYVISKEYFTETTALGSLVVNCSYIDYLSSSESLTGEGKSKI